MVLSSCIMLSMQGSSQRVHSYDTRKMWALLKTVWTNDMKIESMEVEGRGNERLINFREKKRPCGNHYENQFLWDWI